MSIRLAKFRSRTGKKSDVRKGKISSGDRLVPNKNYRNVKDFGGMFKKNNLIDEDSETFVVESDSF